MRKEVLVCSLILCLGFLNGLSVSFVKEAHAIPNSIVPAPDGHPHSCGVPGHAQFIDGTVTWANGSADWAGGRMTNPDGACHQHRSNRDFGGHGNDANEPYSANKVWDNENLRYSTTNPFDRGHGFINEFHDAGGGSNCIPDYWFSPVDQQGNTIVWPAQAQERIREAFNMWGAIESDKPWLATGIAFEEDSPAEIVIYWETLPTAYGRFVPDVWPTRLVFDNSTNWFFNADPTGIGAGQAHFLTVVLHETGHAVGFWHQNDPGELMYPGLDPRTTFFQGLDTGCVEGVRDLYSIPAPDLGDAPDPLISDFPHRKRWGS